MNLEYITAPIIGGIIGYVTNNIAVKMLFKPRNPIYIGKFKLPFTPGIIPKGKTRLAKAIGDAVGEQLLTPRILKDTLLSESMRLELYSQMQLYIEGLKTNDTPLSFYFTNLLQYEEKSNAFKTNLTSLLTKKMSDKISSLELGSLISNEVLAAVHSKIEGTMIAMFVKPEFLAPIAVEIQKRVDQYITDHGSHILHEFLEEEYDYFIEQPVSQLVKPISTEEIQVILYELYCKIINQYADSFLSTLQLSKIVEDKINAMEVEEVETLIFSIMKKELAAIVNLGAVIGFLLGLFNLLF